MIALGLDVGTTAVKALAVDQDGRVVARAQRDHRLLTPQPGWVELDPQAVWRAARHVIGQVTAGLPRPPVVVGSSSLGEAFVPVDASGRPLGNAIVSFDRRAVDEYEAAMQSPGRDVFETETGVRPLAHHAVFKWLWWRRHRPEVFARTSAFVGLASWVASRLGATPAIDPSLAIRTAVYRPESGSWAEELVTRLGIPMGLLPPLRASDAACGEVAEGGARLGLRPGTPIVVGGLDQACAAFELGTDGSRGMLTLGTTAVVCVGRPDRADIPMDIPAVPKVDRRGWLAMAGSPAGGTALRWLRDHVLAGGRPGAQPYWPLVQGVAEHRTDVLFLPHLGGSRVAFDDPSATAAFTGLTHASDRTDLIRAVLDGVAYEIAMLLQRLNGAGLNVSEMRANGGASASRVWMQIIADATGIAIESVGDSDSAARGAARLARGAARPTSRPATDPVAFRVEPRSEWRTYHSERLGRYATTYQALRSTRA